MGVDATVVSPDRVHVDAEVASAFTRALFEGHDLPPADAAIVTDNLVRADLRGVDSHGLGFVPLYLRRLRAGLINPRPKLELRKMTPVAGALHGDDGFGHVVATRGIDESIAMARDYGIGMVAVRRSTHFGMAANYVLRAIDAGYIGIVFTNASRGLPPHGGREPIFGTSPLAFGVPGGESADFVLDMSPAVAARGKIRRAERLGEPIPEGYALDADGRSTTDPSRVLDGGVLLPLGGPKGAGLSILMDIMAGVFTGAAFAGDVRSQFDDFDDVQNVGHFLLAIKPDLFVSAEEFGDRMDVLVERTHACPPAEGFADVLLPGEPEERVRERRLASGIPYNIAEIDALNEEAARLGLAPLATSPAPPSPASQDT